MSKLMWIGRNLYVAAASIAAATSASNATTLYVPGEFATIGEGIVAASEGDTVLVARGTFHEMLDLHGKEIVLRSEAGPDYTTVDADRRGSVLTCMSGETTRSVVDGFTLTGGFAELGGGIRVRDSSPSFHHLIVRGNEAIAEGGGMHILHDHLEVYGIVLIQNRAPRGAGLFAIDGVYSLDELMAGYNEAAGDGGGVWISRGTLVLNRPILEGNTGVNGAGALVDNGNLEIYGGRISGNSASERGGGVHSRCARVDLERLLVERNSSAEGGGLALLDGQISLDRVAVLHNEAGDAGGGFHLERALTDAFQLTVHGNEAPAGSGLYAVDLHATISSSLVTRNRGGAGIEALRVVPTLIYNDVWGNAGGGYNGIVPGSNDISADPKYVATAWNDYRLLWGSAAIDGGDPAGRLDEDGTRADLGAFAFDRSDDLELYLSSHDYRIAPGGRIEVLHTTINSSADPIRAEAVIELGLPGGGRKHLRAMEKWVPSARAEGYSSQKVWSATMPRNARAGRYEYRVDLGQFGVSRLPLYVDR